MMDFYIYRNSTLENIFGNQGFKYSGYGDISNADFQSDVFVYLYFLPLDLTQDLLVAELESYFDRIQLIRSQLPINKTFVVFTIENLQYLKFELSDFRLKNAINNFNNKLIKLAAEHAHVKVFDIENFTANYAASELFDWKYYFLSKTILHPRLAKAFKNWFYMQIDRLNFNSKKCLILDLDNTLWAGVLGEDGENGIKIGGDYPGNAFLLFQQNLLELSKNGILLAIASKNNESDVLTLWQNHPFLLLKKEHFAAYRINWNNKADNIQEIAAELNIGLDTVVFVDDNPAERDLLKTVLPQVEVPEFPAQAYELIAFFKHLLELYFLPYQLTNNDKIRNQQYQENIARKSLEKSELNIESYWANLQMHLNIQLANSFTLSRVAQMTQKTNQFNLTTKRYTEAQIGELMQQYNAVFTVNVSDKFGDNGIAALAIINYLDDSSIEIDTLLLSCRVIGRGIETAFVQWLLNFMKQQGYQIVFATFKPTAKNGQVELFWDNMGFELLSATAEAKCYKLNLEKTQFDLAAYYKISSFVN